MINNVTNEYSSGSLVNTIDLFHTSYLLDWRYNAGPYRIFTFHQSQPEGEKMYLLNSLKLTSQYIRPIFFIIIQKYNSYLTLKFKRGSFKYRQILICKTKYFLNSNKFWFGKRNFFNLMNSNLNRELVLWISFL